jgi:hypothetical protein
MNRTGRKISIIIASFMLAVLTFVAAPQVGGWVQSGWIKHTQAQAVPQQDAANVMGPFLAGLKTAGSYSISGTKQITGGGEAYSMDFSCVVNGADYVVRTVMNFHTIRQLYIGGKYSVADDTALKTYANALLIDTPDHYMQQALSGRLIRSHGEILNGNQVTCIEFYKDGRVYSFFLNQQGALVKYYYVFEGSEVTLDITQAGVGTPSSPSFTIPGNYVSGDISEIKKIESGTTSEIKK